jgi:hypothetical protein
MPQAVIPAAVMAVGSVGGALLSSSAQKKASQQATDAMTAANNQAMAAQIQLGQQSLNQAGNIYKSNFNLLSPNVSRGNVAGDAINALLGLPNAPQLGPPDIGEGTAPGTGAPTPNALSQYAGPTPQQIAAMQHDGIPGNYRNALAQMGVNQGGGGPGIPGIVSPIGALLTGGRVL